MHVDHRAVLAIKVCMNKIIGNKNSIHLLISRMISEYSHATVLKQGSIFQTDGNLIYIVARVKSPFFVSITRVPMIRLMASLWEVLCVPDWGKASRFYIKKVFDPFSFHPYFKQRHRRVYLKRNL